MKVDKSNGYISIDDVYYDIFDGGYISPDILTNPEDIERVRLAIDTIEEFVGAIETHNENHDEDILGHDPYDEDDEYDEEEDGEEY